MPSFADDLLQTAVDLLERRPGQKGPLKAARVRRSISTAYYGLFHFCLDETARRLVGADGRQQRRRRTFARVLSHAGLTVAFGKLKGAAVDRSVEDLFRVAEAGPGPVATPALVRDLASAYLDVRAQREDADYDLNAALSEIDARRILARVRRAIQGWDETDTRADAETKQAVALLVSQRGRLRD